LKVTIEGPRLMDKLLHGADISTNSEGIISIDEGEWESVGEKKAAQRSYFDLSGYNKPSLTTFFQGIDFQYASPPTTDSSRMALFDMITTEYLTNEELDTVFSANIKSAPGFTMSTLNMEQIVYARLRAYAWPGIPDPGSLSVPLHNVDLWGTCNATTADKLHITRVVVFGSALKSAMIPDVNVVVTAIIGKEKTLPYLMRQKRSFELSTRT